jgi:hypothetical protein
MEEVRRREKRIDGSGKKKEATRKRIRQGEDKEEKE